MTINPSLPITGRPLKSVLQINNALRDGAEVYCELADGTVQKILKSRRKGGVFQVKLENNQWAASPRRVWATKAATDAPPVGKIHITRTPVGERSLDDLQALAFQEPMWLEATIDSKWVIMPQWCRRRLAFKSWSQERPIFTAPTFTEFVALMREQEWTNQLLDHDEHAPLRSWLIAAPVVQHDGVG